MKSVYYLVHLTRSIAALFFNNLSSHACMQVVQPINGDPFIGMLEVCVRMHAYIHAYACMHAYIHACRPLHSVLPSKPRMHEPHGGIHNKGSDQ